MSELKEMTVRALRDLARKHIGPGYSKLKTKSELVAALDKVLPRSVQVVLEPKEQPMAANVPTKHPGEVPLRGEPEHGAATPTGPDASKPAAPSEPDPEAHLVARVVGEAALESAEIPLSEQKLAPAEQPASAQAAADHAAPPAGVPAALPEFDEQLGELPESYGEDTVTLLPKDPYSLYLFWDFARETVQKAFEWMPGLHTKIRIFADNDLVREVDFSLDSRSWYFHGLQPGRNYRVELVSMGLDGQSRRLGPASNAVRLPPDGPSPVIDDRFVRLPFELPAGRMGETLRSEPARVTPPAFPEETRGQLYQMSGGETRSLGASEQRAVGGITAAPPPPGPGPHEVLTRRGVGVRSSGPWPWSGSMPWSGTMPSSGSIPRRSNGSGNEGGR